MKIVEKVTFWKYRNFGGIINKSIYLEMSRKIVGHLQGRELLIKNVKNVKEMKKGEKE